MIGDGVIWDVATLCLADRRSPFDLGTSIDSVRFESRRNSQWNADG